MLSPEGRKHSDLHMTANISCFVGDGEIWQISVQEKKKMTTLLVTYERNHK